MVKYEDGCYGSLKGVALIGKVLAGRCKMHYTRVAVGKGTLPEGMTPKTLEEPPEYVMDAMISSVTNPVDGECQVAAQINSRDVEKGFYAKWLILYAEDPDDGEVPYTALRLEDDPEWIRPSSSMVGKLAHFDIIAAVRDVDEVFATIDPDAFATTEEVKRLIAGATVRRSVAIPAEGWAEGADEAGGDLYVDIPQSDVTAEMVPFMHIIPAHMDTARNCGLSNTIRTLDGALRVYARLPPSVPIETEVTLLCASSGPAHAIGGEFPIATASQVGAVKPGDGLRVAKDGTLSVNTASDSEVNEMLAGVMASDDK